MAFTPPIGSTVAFQSDPTKLQVTASVAGKVDIGNMPSVYGNISGSVIAVVNNIPSISGTVLVNNGSVAAWLQSSNASVITVGTAAPNQSVSGVVGASVIGLPTVQTGNNSVITLIQGSVAVSVSPPANQSVSGTVQGELLSTNASVITISKSSVAVAIVSGSIAASFTPPANQSVSGTIDIGVIPGSVVTYQGGTQITSLVSTIPSSVIVGASIFGLPPVNVTNFPTTQNVSGSVAAFIVGSSSIITTSQGSVAVAIISGSVAVATGNSSVMLLNSSNVIGSVIGYQGVVPWIVNFQNSSILAVPVGSVISAIQGSVAAFQGGTWNVSVVGNMAGTSSVYQVLSSITTISIMAANTNRKTGTIYNTANTAVFVKLGTAATTSVYTVLMNPNDYYELPGGWTGVVAGISNSTAGVIQVTELT